MLSFGPSPEWAVERIRSRGWLVRATARDASAVVLDHVQWPLQSSAQAARQAFGAFGAIVSAEADVSEEKITIRFSELESADRALSALLGSHPRVLVTTD